MSYILLLIAYLQHTALDIHFQNCHSLELLTLQKAEQEAKRQAKRDKQKERDSRRKKVA